jgi:hypothetical protein
MKEQHIELTLFYCDCGALINKEGQLRGMCEKCWDKSNESE